MSKDDDAIRAAIVKIVGLDDKGKEKLWGTGILVAPGVVMTCAHVVANSEGEGGKGIPYSFWVIDSNGEKYDGPEKVDFHDTLDLARFEVSGLVQQPHRELLSFEPSAGEKFRFYGFPRLAECGHWGLINFQGVLDDGLLQCDMSWAGAGTKSEDVAGASGSPLLSAGKVIGFLASVQRKGEMIVARRAHVICVKHALELDDLFFADCVSHNTPLEEFLIAQVGLRGRHVFGNIPVENMPRQDGFPWLPLEAIYE
jgi:hypothetical protein